MIRDQTSYSEYTVNISVVLCSVKAHGCDKAVGGIINRKEHVNCSNRAILSAWCIACFILMLRCSFVPQFQINIL